MLVSGALRNSLSYRVTQRSLKDSIKISIFRGYKEDGMRPVGVYNSYGEYLNQKHPLLQGWKERTYEILDRRLRQL